MITYQVYKSDNNKKSLLLIHGWNTSELYMEMFIKPFKNDFNIVNLNLFKSIDKAYSIDDYVEEIHQIVEENLGDQLFIIGHSFGGKIAYFYSQKYLTSGLVLIAPSLIKPHINIISKIKVKIFKFLKKHHLKIPKSLMGSNDYQNAKGKMKETFLRCVNVYLTKTNLNHPKTLVFGFNNDQQVKKYQIKKIKKYLPNAKIIFYHGDHFSYLDQIKEITLEINAYFN